MFTHRDSLMLPFPIQKHGLNRATGLQEIKGGLQPKACYSVFQKSVAIQRLCITMCEHERAEPKRDGFWGNALNQKSQFPCHLSAPKALSISQAAPPCPRRFPSLKPLLRAKGAFHPSLGQRPRNEVEKPERAEGPLNPTHTVRHIRPGIS